MNTHTRTVFNLSFSQKIKTYLELSKSGIVFLVLISTFAGYFSGHNLQSEFSWPTLLWTLLGLLFLASGSSALNQVQEMRLDAQMPRTQNRPLPIGKISPTEAKLFSAMSIVFGCLFLSFVSESVLLFGLLALISYNGLYTLWWKPQYPYAAIPGAIPGALPILIGYAAASGQPFAAGGLYLFFILFFWQMPHFWVLAMKYQSDYAQGRIPTLPVAHGPALTLYQITLWCLGYLGVIFLAPLFLNVHWVYLGCAFLISLKILYELVRYYRECKNTPPLGKEKSWLRFFLWINFSLILFLLAVVADLWGVYLQLAFVRS